MGADRKGPLAAFIVVAIIAAILLITSVRSQAATAWLGRALPSTPGVVRAVGGGLDHVFEQGAVLVHKARPVAPPESRATSATTAGAPVAPGNATPSHEGAAPPAPHPVHHQSGHLVGPAPTAPPVGSAPDAVRPGRHLGWTHAPHGGHGHGRPDQGDQDPGHPDHGHSDHGHPEHPHSDHGHSDHGHPEHGRHLGRHR